MALRTKQNDWRLLPLLTLVFLGINILGCEWSWGSNIPLLLSWLIQSTPIVGLFLLAAASGAFVLESFSDHARCWIYFWLGIYILVLLGGILIWFTSSPSPWIYVGLAQALIGGFVGCRIGKTPEAAEWTLRTLARVAAIVSVYKFVTPDVETGSAFPSLGVGWPIGIYILFGLCWYLYTALTVPRLSKEVVLGALACALRGFCLVSQAYCVCRTWQHGSHRFNFTIYSVDTRKGKSSLGIRNCHAEYHDVCRSLVHWR